jgi:hypothetical protein
LDPILSSYVVWIFFGWGYRRWLGVRNLLRREGVVRGSAEEVDVENWVDTPRGIETNGVRAYEG